MTRPAFRPLETRDYLERLGLTGLGPPGIGTLRLLHERHLHSVPFENLDIQRGVPIVLELPALLDKIVLRRRGGFCYELNGAFAWLLRELGYRVSLLAAEVARPEGGFGIPFDHLTLRVDLERPYLADVGFGEGFRHPLPLESPEVVVQDGASYRIREEGSYRILERATAKEPLRPQYRFTLTPRELTDFAEGCRHHQTSPESTFTRKTVCTRALPEGRITLTADRLIETRGENRTETPLPDRASWERALRENFGIEL